MVVFSDLPTVTSLADTDRLFATVDPTGTPLSRTIAVPDALRLGYGEIYTFNAATAQALASSTWTKLTAFTADGEERSGVVDADVANDRIGCLVAGRYKVSTNVSFKIDVATRFGIAIYKGPTGSIANTNRWGHCQIIAGEVGIERNVQTQGIINVSAPTEYVEVWGWSNVASNLTVIAAQLTVERLS